MKKFFSKVFKSRAFRIFMIPVIMFGAVALGAGTGYLMTSQTIPGTAEAASTVTQKPNDLYSRLGTTDDSSSDYAPGPSEPAPTTSSSTPTSKPKVKSQSTTTTPTTPACDQTQKTLYYNQYQSALDNENTLYITNQKDPSYKDDPTTEDNRHDAAVGQLFQDYQANLKSINC